MKKIGKYICLVIIVLLALLTFMPDMIVGPSQRQINARARLMMLAASVQAYWDTYHEKPANLLLAVKNQGSTNVPAEPYSESTREVREYDGNGGWVYNPEKNELSINYYKWIGPNLNSKYKVILKFTSPEQEKGN